MTLVISAILLLTGAIPQRLWATPADSFSVQLNLKITGAIDLRAWDQPTALNKYVLSDTTAALLRTEIPQFKTVTEMDSTDQTVMIRRKMNQKDFLQPIVFSRDEYAKFRLQHDQVTQFRDESLKNLKKTGLAAGAEALTIEIPFKIKSKTFNSIFGGDRVRLRISGNINIEGGFRREGHSQVTTIQGQQANLNFHINQTQNFKITGEIGDKVAVEVDQDSRRMFEFENSLKLTYTGYEDEIIQKIEAGNISMQLAGTQLATFSGQNKGLFGLKAELKMGPFSLTTIASLEKGQKNKLQVQGGAQETSIEVPVNQPTDGRYFFLGPYFREQYKIFNTSMQHTLSTTAIDQNNFYVYKRYTYGGTSVPADLIYAYAAYDSAAEVNPASFYEKAIINAKRADSTLADRNFQPGNYVRLDPSQYSVNIQLGYIRLSTPLTDTDVLAVAYLLEDNTSFGTLNPQQGDTAVLKLIRPENPLPTDDTWPLAWRNVYSLQGVSIDKESFSLKITYNPSGASEQETMNFQGAQKTFLTLFGLDTKNSTGQDNPDGLVDDNPALINYSYGEIIFPDLRPFDPEGYYFNNPSTPAPYFGNPADYPDSLRIPSIYDSTQLVSTDFKIKASFKSVKAVYQLGFNVLEGSEEVYLGGSRLSRGSDYVIDYYSGTLTVLNQAALSPSANLEIVYESGELFQLDKKTLLGVRGEYQLWDQSFIGATALYLSEKPLQDRVRIGNEPLRNFLWDVNTRLVFKPKFITTAIDKLPLVETETPSEVRLEAEFAQVHPDPNSLNNNATGDPNGVAYVDDFESIKKTTPLGIMRRQWRTASNPVSSMPTANKGTFVWFNPFDQVAIEDVWPNRPTNPNVAQRTHVLSMFFSPVAPDNGAPPIKTSPLTYSWGGVQRSLSAGYQNQVNSRYLEITLKVGKRNSSKLNTPGRLHIDLGQINEDVIPNGILDTEDNNLEGLPYGDGFCDQSEDRGIDRMAGADTTDWWDLNQNGIRDPGEPSSRDDWAYNPSDPYNVWKINGTEGNYNDEGGRYPDTEDLDNDNFLDQVSNYFRYTVDLSEFEVSPTYPIQPPGDPNPSTRFLVSPPNDKGWKLYRIPLEAGEQIGSPNITQLEFARVWLDGFTSADTFEVSIATLEIVGNEWRSVPISINNGEIYERVAVEVMNTYDNPLYTPPPGVAGYRDPVTDIVSQEQSLLLRINDVPRDTSGIIVRQLYDVQDYLEYRKLKMFVHGGGIDEVLNNEIFNNRNIWMFFRFGSDTTRNYYEYRQKVHPGWDPKNDIEIDLAQLTALKLNSTDPNEVTSIMVGDGDSLSVKGNPSLSQIRNFTVGVVPRDRDISELEGLQIWLDELRVSDVKREIGRAARASANFTLADLATINTNIAAQDGNFHNVNTRMGTRSNSLTGAATASMQMHKFLDPKWGLSIPVSGNFSQSETVPYYFPNSDILVDRGNPAQVDTVKSYSRSYGGGIDVSKNLPSASPVLKYTVDPLSVGYDYSYQESTNPTTKIANSTTNSANVAYNLTMGRPSLNFLGWLKNVPVLSRYSKLKFYYLITKVSLSLDGSETVSDNEYRSGIQQGTHMFFLTKHFSTGFKPFDNFTVDYDRTHKADLLKDPAHHKGVGDILQGDLGWTEDVDVDQRFGAGYTPRPFNWLDTDLRYSSNYHWNWGNGYISTGQQITNNNTISASATFKLTQILKKPTRDGEPGEQPYPDQPQNPYQQQQQPPIPPNPGGDDKNGQGGEILFAQQLGDTLSTQQPGLQPGTPGYDSTRVDSTQVDTTFRALPEIAKPTKRGAIADFWYAVRYTFTRLRDVRVDYTQQKNWMDPLVDGQAGIGYQLGYNSHDYNKIDSAAFYTGFSTRARTDDYKIKSGLDFSRNIKMNLDYSYGWSRNESSSIVGSTKQSRLYFFKAQGDSMGVFELPIPDWSLTWSGLEKWPAFQNMAQTVSLENTYSGSKNSSWNDNRNNVRQHDYSRNFSPLVGVNITWKKNVSTTFRYNWTETGSVVLIPTRSKSRNVQKSAQLSASYSMKTGFKIPIPVWPFKNKRFSNNTTLTLTFNMANNTTANEALGKFIETNFTKTWSIKPALDYTFSNTVTGGMHFEYGSNKSKASDSNYQEFGIRVNITIRG